MNTPNSKLIINLHIFIHIERVNAVTIVQQ